MKIWDFGQDAWLGWQEPLWLLAVLFILIGLLCRNRPHKVAKTYSHLKSTGGRIRSRLLVALPLFFIVLALVSTVGAIADLTRNYVAVEGKAVVHRIFVWVDSSSSMRWVTTVPRGYDPSVTCGSEHVRFYPRIYGACRALNRLIDEVEKTAEKKKNFRERDLIGIGQFALYSYVISYPSNDYARLKEKVKKMEFISSDLGIYTNVHLGMWDMYLMALARNLRQDSGYTNLSGKELRRVATSLVPGGAGREYEPPRELREKLLRIRQEFRDTMFIVITDATLHQMDNTLEAGPLGLRRQLELAAFLELPVVFFSTDEFHIELKRLARLTGFGSPDGAYRGDFLVVKRERELYNIEEAVSKILLGRFTLTVPTREVRRISYSEYFIFAALTFGGLAVLLQKTASRSLTDR